MYIDPKLRHRAAQTWIDGMVSYDDNTDSDATEDALLLALDPLGIDFNNCDPETAAALAAAFDLLFFITAHTAQVTDGVDHLAYLSNLRTHVLPLVYPDVS